MNCHRNREWHWSPEIRSRGGFLQTEELDTELSTAINGGGMWALGMCASTYWLSGSVWGQAQGWQSSGVPTPGSPKKPGAHSSQKSPCVLCRQFCNEMHIAFTNLHILSFHFKANISHVLFSCFIPGTCQSRGGRSQSGQSIHRVHSNPGINLLLHECIQVHNPKGNTRWFRYSYKLGHAFFTSAKMRRSTLFPEPAASCSTKC